MRTLPKALTLVPVLGLATILGCHVVDHGGLGVQRQPLIGGQPVPEDEWTSIGWLPATGCTGVMVSDRALLYAGHCGTQHELVTFEPSFQFSIPEDAAPPFPTTLRGTAISHCVARDTAIGSGNDLALCFLKEPHMGQVERIASEEDRSGLRLNDEVLLLGYGPPGQDEETLTKTAVWAPLQGFGLELFIGDDYRGTCPGDSGSPALTERAGSFRLVGILSSGEVSSCGAGWYTDVYTHHAWIEETIARNSGASSTKASCGLAGARSSTESGPLTVLAAVTLLMIRRRCHAAIGPTGARSSGSRR